MSEPIAVHIFGGFWGMPSPSPFCVKLETWLRMAALEYRTVPASGPPRSSNGKLPYIERADGTLLADSQVIADTLTREHDIALDASLSPAQRATGLLTRRMLEEHLYWIIVAERWLDDGNWPVVARDYFAGLPWPLRLFVSTLARRGVRTAARGQGVIRYPAAARTRLIQDDLDAIEHTLGERAFLLGEPSSVDAAGFAFLASAISAPFDSELKRAVLARDPLVDYVERCRARWWPELAPFPRA